MLNLGTAKQGKGYEPNSGAMFFSDDDDWTRKDPCYGLRLKIVGS
jgi:hypothetical protein